MLEGKGPWWPHARITERVARDTVERHTFNAGAEYVGLYAEAETFVRLGDNAVNIAAYNGADVDRVPAGEWVILPLIGFKGRGATKSNTTLAFRAPVDNRLKIKEWDNPNIDIGATGGSY